MTVKPHVAVRKRSVCDLVRLAVRPVNSDLTSSFEFCLTYTINDEKTPENSLDLDMVMFTRKQPVVLKLDLYSSLFFFLDRPSPNDSDKAYFAGFV